MENLPVLRCDQKMLGNEHEPTLFELVTQQGTALKSTIEDWFESYEETPSGK
jgi:hypothetical protein